MTAIVAFNSNPLVPDPRQMRMHQIDHSITVRNWLTTQGIEEFQQPTICLYNGSPLLRAEWRQTEIRDGDLVEFRTLVQGGGSESDSSGGSNPLTVVVSVAMIVGGAMLGGPIGGMVMRAGFGVLAGQIMSALAPRPDPVQQANPNTADIPAASPTYNASLQGNTARLGGVIPVGYGRHMSYPDYASQPYAEYESNEQYIYAHLCIGQGNYDYESIRIVDTDIDNFTGVTWWWLRPGDAWPVGAGDEHIVTAQEVSNQTLVAPNENPAGDYVGPMIVNPAGADAVIDRIDVDILMPRGLYYADTNGNLTNKTINWTVEAQQIDDDGVATGSWIVLGNESHTAATVTSQRLTGKYAVTEGRWQVRIKRTDDKDFSTRAGHELRWASLKGRMTALGDYTAVTRLVVKFEATDTNQQIGMINVIWKRLLPTWDSINGWNTEAYTQNPAWALADMWRSNYGAEGDDARLVLTQLESLAQTWATRGDTFNAIYDSQTTVWKAMQQVGRAVRTRPIMQLGVVHLVRDEQKSVDYGMYTPSNIVRGTFGVTFVPPSEDTADALEVTYYDEDVWRDQQVRIALPDSNQERIARIRLFGVTNKDQVIREGHFIIADNRYRRIIPSWQSELEGHSAYYGQPVALVHDIPEWGQWGEAVWWSEPTLTLTISEPLAWTAGETHYAALGKRDGTLDGPYPVTQGVNDYEVVFATLPTAAIYTGGLEERTRVAFGAGDDWSESVLVTGIRPRGNKVELTAVVDDDRVHDDNDYVLF